MLASEKDFVSQKTFLSSPPEIHHSYAVQNCHYHAISILEQKNGINKIVFHGDISKTN